MRRNHDYYVKFVDVVSQKIYINDELRAEDNGSAVNDSRLQVFCYCCQTIRNRIIQQNKHFDKTNEDFFKIHFHNVFLEPRYARRK